MRRKKTITIELDRDDWWPLCRYAAKEKISIRGLARKTLMPLIDDLKRRYPRQPVNESPSIEDVH
ncbi:hypothetical protein [Gimesia aquarii]|uniref:CopG family transcriptional regulator n=1 Tax=Gimesia aquarii TaxID=2527964 RepID=A0A517X1A8_9PLAN|nr:hypothetical protein [Gimesia aquarii]QDU11284.1 hypothetical protein V202x_47030 [Gimesia aquarii]